MNHNPNPRAKGDITNFDLSENRKGTQKAIEQAKARMSKQDNVQVHIPATEKEQGYTVICSRGNCKLQV